jgi:hypothetical protein
MCLSQAKGISPVQEPLMLRLETLEPQRLCLADTAGAAQRVRLTAVVLPIS